MSLIKLAIYGGIGYLVYQTFFADMPASGMERGRPRTRQQRDSSGGQRISGGGRGTVVSTEEPSGTSQQHRVGRGVVT